MIIDFNSLPEKVTEKFKCGEGEFISRMFTDDKVKIGKCRLTPGSSIGFHNHELDCEVLFVLSGSGYVKTDEGKELIQAGQAHYCRLGGSHSIVNDGKEDLVFFNVIPVQK